MFRFQLRFAFISAAVALGLNNARTCAQVPSTGVTAGLAAATQYPDRFQEGCGDPAGGAGSVRLHQRVHRLVTAELGLSAQFQFPPGNYATCGDVVPLADGDTIWTFAPSRGSLSLAAEARLVLTPVSNEAGTLRFIGGGAWYPARQSPAWIAGAGYRPHTRWGTLVVDVERWNVGVEYELERFRTGAPREPLGEGREWQAFWQIRFGITLWSL